MPDQSYYLLPITHTDFLDWYNRRYKAYSGLKLIPAVIKDGEADIDNTEWSKPNFVDSLPPYEEDFQVLVALLNMEQDRKKWRRNEIGKIVPAFHEIDICDIQRLYPITQRGARMLGVRLPSGVKLGPPIFEDMIGEKEQERLREQQKAGGDVLLEIFGLSVHDGEIDPLKEEILDAVHAKVTRQNEKPPSTLLGAVIRYDRQDKPEFPSTPIGTLFDYLEVLKVYLRGWFNKSGGTQETGSKIRSVFEEAGQALRDMGRDANPYEAVNNDVLKESLQELKEIADLDFDQCPPKAAMLYLDIREQLREDDLLQETTLQHWTETLKATGNHRSAAVGLWTVGAFFGFSTFADACYEYRDASFLRELDLGLEEETEENSQPLDADLEVESSVEK